MSIFNLLNPTTLGEIQNNCGFNKMEYSRTSVLVSFTSHQTLYSPHFDEKNMFQHMALARDSSHLLGRV